MGHFFLFSFFPIFLHPLVLEGVDENLCGLNFMGYEDDNIEGRWYFIA
jgi:hypothetical protein